MLNNDKIANDMKTYYSTFITGFTDVIKENLGKHLKDVQIDLIADGLVVYKTSADIDAIKRLRFLNNSFLLIRHFPKLGSNPIQEMVKQVANDSRLTPILRNPLMGQRAKFRVMAMSENQTVKMDNNLRKRLEENISRGNYLSLNRSLPDVEFLFSTRREGFGLFGLRFTKRPNYEKTLEKGELYPELAYLLCLISEPTANDTFLDPFSGSGSIPITRMLGFPFKAVYASDNDKKLIEKIKAKVRKIRGNFVMGNWNALQLTNFSKGSIDKIVTDPPWGLHSGKELNLERFYEDMLKEFSRLLRKDGVLVLLTAQKELMEALLNKFTNELNLIKRYDTLVSGKKAGAYKIRKVSD